MTIKGNLTSILTGAAMLLNSNVTLGNQTQDNILKSYEFDRCVMISHNIDGLGDKDDSKSFLYMINLEGVKKQKDIFSNSENESEQRKAMLEIQEFGNSLLEKKRKEYDSKCIDKKTEASTVKEYCVDKGMFSYLHHKTSFCGIWDKNNLGDPDKIISQSSRILTDGEFKNCVHSSIVLEDYKIDLANIKPAYDKFKQADYELEWRRDKINYNNEIMNNSGVDSSSPNWKIANHNRTVENNIELIGEYNSRIKTFKANLEKDNKIRNKYTLAEMMLKYSQTEYTKECTTKIRAKVPTIEKYCSLNESEESTNTSESKFCSTWKIK